MKIFHFDEQGHLNEEGVALYVDALRLERTERLPEVLRAHVTECQKCRVNVTGLYSLLAEQALEDSHPTLDKTAKVWQAPAVYRVAAVIAVAIGILAVVHFYGNTDRAVQQAPAAATVETPAKPESTSAIKVERAEPKEIAANFRPYAELEGLVGSELRGEFFEVTSPGEVLTKGRAITFSWKTAGTGPWKIIVLDNRGGIVKEAEVRSAAFVLEGPFRPGLYYWKVIQNDELAHVGKFRVE
jgi:hypothetical protein